MLAPLQVNKPTLPLASGEYSPATGVAIVSVSAAMVTKLILSRKKLEVLFLCYLYLTFPFLYIWNYGS
jgi:hypothetical protein